MTILQWPCHPSILIYLDARCQRHFTAEVHESTLGHSAMLNIFLLRRFIDTCRHHSDPDHKPILGRELAGAHFFALAMLTPPFSSIYALTACYNHLERDFELSARSSLNWPLIEVVVICEKATPRVKSLDRLRLLQTGTHD